MPKVIYLMGTARSEVSLAARMLQGRVPRLLVWEYEARLAEQVRGRANSVITHDGHRAHSTEIVTSEDVEAVNRAMSVFVAKHRASRHVLVVSHSPAKDRRGYRFMPLSVERLATLAPDEVWMFSAGLEEAERHIAEGPSDAGAPTALQMSLATTYCASLGLPLHLFDASASKENLIPHLVERLA